ncbi:acyl-CoA dehydrogenase family protein [Parasphingorhabdus sp. JC815]|uniref:acyl-CoA dehydrogenase family protein n=1 Tax=Parasphingorhabdus sp. JC815 TaxID=3232140 RepID=UPI003459624E
MIDTLGMVAETATKIYTDLCGRDVPHQAEAGTYPQDLWGALVENGLSLAWVSEDNGGFGADYAEVFGAIWASAQAASPVPFAETLIANWLLDRAGLAPVEGSASFALLGGTDGAQPTADIPFGMHADQIVLFDEMPGDGESEIALFDNVAASRIAVDALSPDGATRFVFSGQRALASAKTNISRRAVEALVLTVRAVQMAAMIEAALDLSIAYVSEREQFGRPLSKFQAIQQQLAVAASESAAATMAATQAASSIALHKDDPEKAWHEAVVAKVQIGHSVEAVTVPFHQVHGAMGYTQEYDLHHYTRRLWAWRDEMGNEHHWSKVLGEELSEGSSDSNSVTNSSTDRIWKGVTTGNWAAI